MENLSDIKIEAEDGSIFHCHKCILVGRLGKKLAHCIRISCRRVRPVSNVELPLCPTQFSLARHQSVFLQLPF